MVAFKELELVKVHTDDKRVDMMKKSLPRGKMQRDRGNGGFLQLVGGGVFWLLLDGGNPISLVGDNQT